MGLGPAGRRRDVPRASSPGVADVRTRCPRASGSSASSSRPVIAGDLERVPCLSGHSNGGWRTQGPTVDGRAPVHVGRSPGGRRTGRPRPPPRRRPRRRRRGDLLRRPGEDAPTGLLGSLAIAAFARRRHRAQARASFDPVERHRALGGLRRRWPARGRSRRPWRWLERPAGRGRRRGRGRDRRPGARRAPVDPVRDRLGPADGRVRGRPALVEALHARLGTERPAGLGPGHARPRGAPDWRRRIEAWQAPCLADPERPLEQDGPVQRAVLPRRRRLVLGARRGRAAGAAGRPRGPVRPPRVPRLPVLRHGRCRLLRVVRHP